MLLKLKETEESPPQDSVMNHTTKNNALKVLSLTMSAVHFGYYMNIFNTMGAPIFVGVYGYSVDKKDVAVSNVNMLFSIGALIGVSITGKLAESFGRRRMILVYDMLAVIACILYSVQDIYILYLTRLITGVVGPGGFTLSNIMQSELLPKSISPVGNAMSQGILLAFVFMSYIQTNVFSEKFLIENWRVVMSWTVGISVIKILLVANSITVESPKYVVRKSYKQDDRDYKLKSIYSETHDDKDVNMMVSQCVELYEKELRSSQKSSVIGQVFSKSMRKRLFAGCLIGISQSLSGVPYFALYSTDLFDRISNNGKKVTFSLAIAKLAGAVLIVGATKLFGRKKNMFFGLFLQGISIGLILLSIHLTVPMLAFVGVFAFICGFAVGTGGSCYIFLAEILPPFAVSIATAATWSSNIIMVKGLPLIAKKLGDEKCLIFFFIMCLILLPLVDYFVIETRNKQESEIIDDYQHKKYRFMDFS